MILLRVRTQLHKTHTHTKEKKRLVKKNKRQQKKANIKQWKDREKSVFVHLQLIFINKN